MTTIRHQFSDSLMFDEFFVVTGSATAIQFMTGTVGMMRMKADIDNEGVFRIGNRADSCLYPLNAGDDTGWVSTSDMNRYWHQNASGSSDYLYYWVQE